MKYNFIFDEGFVENFHLELSDEEIKVVFATVLGGHNALFYGYKPERLSKAVKLFSETQNVHIEKTSNDITLEKFCGGGSELSKGSVSRADGGILVMDNLNEYKSSILQMLGVVLANGNISLSRAGRNVTYPADFQLVATINDFEHWWEKTPHIADACDIVYYCNESEHRNTYNFSELKPLFSCYRERYLRHCTFRKNGKCKTFASVNLSSCAIEQHGEVPLRIGRLAKTLSSMNTHNLVWATDVAIAKRFIKCPPILDSNSLPY